VLRRVTGTTTAIDELERRLRLVLTSSILRSSTSGFSVNDEIIIRNVKVNDVQLQNSNLEFGITPIS